MVGGWRAAFAGVAIGWLTLQAGCHRAEQSRPRLATSADRQGVLPAAARTPASVEAPCVAASAPGAAPRGTLVASDDMPRTLMEAAFPGWNEDGNAFVDLETNADDRCFGAPSDRMALHPRLVIAIDGDHRMLVTSGGDEDEQGHSSGAHAEPGFIGGVLFQRVEGGWRATRTWPVVVVTGSFGQPGEVQGLPLGPAHGAFTIHGGWCGQGYCVSNLDVLEVSGTGFRDLFSTQISSSSVGATGACEEAAGADTAQVRQDLGEGDGFECFDVSGDWRVDRAEGDAWPDLLLEFTGVERPASTTPAASAGARAVSETPVRVRYDGHVYRVIEGRVPVHAM